MPETLAVAAIQQIPVDQIKPSRHQARKDFDEDGIKSLSESIQMEGLIQPISVRKVGEAYELVAGERRLRAVKRLGLQVVNAIVLEVVSEAEASAKGLIENLQRKDLNPIEEAEGIQAMLDLHDSHWTQEQIGKVIGKSQSEISRTLRFLGLSEIIKGNMRRRIITEGHAAELVRLPSQGSQDQVGKKIESGLSVMATRRLVDKLLKTGKGASKSQKPALEDPLAKVWDKAKGDTQLLTGGYWDVSYSRNKNTLGEIVEGWTLHVCPTGKDAPAALTLWLKRIAELVSAAARPADIKRIKEEFGAVAPAAEAPKIPDALRAAIAAIPEDLNEADDSDPEPRLPSSAAEQSELEKLAASGPGPVYAWIFGPKSTMATMMKDMTWEGMGQADPAAGLRKLMEGIRKAQKAKP